MICFYEHLTNFIVHCQEMKMTSSHFSMSRLSLGLGMQEAAVIRRQEYTRSGQVKCLKYSETYADEDIWNPDYIQFHNWLTWEYLWMNSDILNPDWQADWDIESHSSRTQTDKRHIAAQESGPLKHFKSCSASPHLCGFLIPRCQHSVWSMARPLLVPGKVPRPSAANWWPGLVTRSLSTNHRPAEVRSDQSEARVSQV